MKKFILNDLDRRILRRLQSHPNLPIAEVANLCASTPAVVSRRISRLRKEGIILAKEAIIDWQRLGFEVEVSLRVTLDKTQNKAFDEFLKAARCIPEVIELQTLLGRVDVRLSVIAKDMAHYQQIYRDLILNLPHISEIEALLHISRIKSDEILPL